MDTLIERDELLFNSSIKNRVRYVGISAERCVECDEDIPELRRSTLPGITKCVECAE